MARQEGVSEREGEGPLKILVLGGTADSREVAQALVHVGVDVFFSVAGEEGMATVPQGAYPLVGRRQAEDWVFLLQTERIHGVVDASHPYAVKAGQAISEAASETGLPYCRYERPELVPENATMCRDAEEAVQKALELSAPGDRVFLTVGVKLLPVLVPNFRSRDRAIIARVLPTEESIRKAHDAGLAAKEIIAVYGHGTRELNEALFREFQARVVLSKSSGAEGGIPEKAQAVLSMGIPLVLIARPAREGKKVYTVASVLETVTFWKKEVQA